MLIIELEKHVGLTNHVVATRYPIKHVWRDNRKRK